ncbi:MAG TPA: winged helix-turn-helix domain-containing protein [Nitrososphaerales archaeon]|nr:winged helix-turn-helix domain-containing protein [Nitrososphaerales archaeon]
MNSKDQSSERQEPSKNTDVASGGKHSEFEGKKPDLYVIARIINVLKEKGSLNRTALATSTGLAYNRLSSYLDWMIEREFVAISDEGGYVSLTQAGIEVYDDLVRWIFRYVGKLKFPRLE